MRNRVMYIGSYCKFYTRNIKLIYHFIHRFHRFSQHLRSILRRKGENQRKFHQVKRPRCACEFIASQRPREINTGKY